MRPIASSSSMNAFATSTRLSAFGNSSLFVPTSTPFLFGQQQAQLWSRFRFAASSLRDNIWFEQTDSTLQQIPSNIFSSNLHTNPFKVNNQPSIFLPSQTLSNKFTSLSNISSSSLTEEFRQRKITRTNESVLPKFTKENNIKQQSSISKIIFTLTIFAIGLILGYLLTNTFPPGLVWDICMKYFHILYAHLQIIMNYLTFFRLA